jgi:hypothetical protein
MKSKCPSWRGKATVRPRRQGRRGMAFTGAKRKPFYEKGPSGQAPFSRLIARKERCEGIAFIAGESHLARVSVSRPRGVRREAGLSLDALTPGARVTREKGMSELWVG